MSMWTLTLIMVSYLDGSASGIKRQFPTEQACITADLNVRWELEYMNYHQDFRIFLDCSGPNPEAK
jgi:hypothetical protein